MEVPMCGPSAAPTSISSLGGIPDPLTRPLQFSADFLGPLPDLLLPLATPRPPNAEHLREDPQFLPSWRGGVERLVPLG